MHVGIANPRWRGKRSRHSRRMRNPQFYLSGERSMGAMVATDSANQIFELPSGLHLSDTGVCLHDNTTLCIRLINMIQTYNRTHKDQIVVNICDVIWMKQSAFLWQSLSNIKDNERNLMTIEWHEHLNCVVYKRARKNLNWICERPNGENIKSQYIWLEVLLFLILYCDGQRKVT